MMKFNDEQFNTLAQYDAELERILNTRTARNVSDKMVQTIAEIWHAVTRLPKRSYTCSTCRYNLLRRVAEAYRADKATREGEKSNETPKTTKRATKKKTAE